MDKQQRFNGWVEEWRVDTIKEACEVWLDHVLRKSHTPVTSIVQLSRDTLLVALTGWFTDVNLLRSPSIHPRPRTGAEMAANIEVCMGLLADAGVDLEGIRGEHILAANEERLVKFVQAVVLSHYATKFNFAPTIEGMEEYVVSAVSMVCEGFADVEFQTLNDMQTCLPFAALIHSFAPDGFEWKTMKDLQPKNRATVAMEAAYQHLGLPPFFKSSRVANKFEPWSVCLYVLALLETVKEKGGGASDSLTESVYAHRLSAAEDKINELTNQLAHMTSNYTSSQENNKQLQLELYNIEAELNAHKKQVAKLTKKLNVVTDELDELDALTRYPRTYNKIDRLSIDGDSESDTESSSDGDVPPRKVGGFTLNLRSMKAERQREKEEETIAVDEHAVKHVLLNVADSAPDVPEVDAPTGQVSFVYTVVRNAHLLWNADPEAREKCLEVYNKVVRECIDAHMGYDVELNVLGASLTAFGLATAAASFALNLQKKLKDARWPVGLQLLDNFDPPEGQGRVWNGLRVRVGVHTGRPQHVFNQETQRMDYFGQSVNTTRAIAMLAAGGQILISSEIHTVLFESEAGVPPCKIDGVGFVPVDHLPMPIELYSILPLSLAGRTFDEKQEPVPSTKAELERHVAIAVENVEASLLDLQTLRARRNSLKSAVAALDEIVSEVGVAVRNDAYVDMRHFSWLLSHSRRLTIATTLFDDRLQISVDKCRDTAGLVKSIRSGLLDMKKMATPHRTLRALEANNVVEKLLLNTRAKSGGSSAYSDMMNELRSPKSPVSLLNLVNTEQPMSPKSPISPISPPDGTLAPPLSNSGKAGRRRAESNRSMSELHAMRAKKRTISGEGLSPPPPLGSSGGSLRRLSPMHLAITEEMKGSNNRSSGKRGSGYREGREGDNDSPPPSPSPDGRRRRKRKSRRSKSMEPSAADAVTNTEATPHSFTSASNSLTPSPTHVSPHEYTSPTTGLVVQSNSHGSGVGSGGGSSRRRKSSTPHPVKQSRSAHDLYSGEVSLAAAAHIASVSSPATGTTSPAAPASRALKPIEVAQLHTLSSSSELFDEQHINDMHASTGRRKRRSHSDDRSSHGHVSPSRTPPSKSPVNPPLHEIKRAPLEPIPSSTKR